MDGVIQALVNALLGGGPGAVIALLVGAIVLLIWDRRKLLESIDKKEEKIEKIIDDYYRGNLTLTEALNGLKLVLMEIKGKL